MSQSPSRDVESSGDDPVPETIGHFVLLEELGRGGIGRVYAAHDPKLERKVAIKLVSAGRSLRGRATVAQRRLLREAQAMAKVAHPNVVQVFEAGVWSRGVWLAMELVEGGTLSDWLAAERRPWRAILDRFIGAGRGLAAAHAAGLVHRDFKPDNVLVGADGRARVADFGLVRPDRLSESIETTEPPPPPPLGDAADEHPGDTPVDGSVDPGEPGEPGDPAEPGEPGEGAAASGLWDAPLDTTPLTRVGALLGTPRYMAPEQLRREGADARSDQFAFCVALYEALFDRPPFAGRSVVDLIETVTAGELRPLPRDSPVPRRIRRAIVRGLANDPSERFPDMDSLLDALSPAGTRPWLSTLMLAAMLAIIAGTVFSLSNRDAAPQLCRGGSERLASVWSDDRRSLVRDRFATSELPYAASSLALVERELDDWAEEWIDAYTRACEAHHVLGEQSSEAFDLRMQCLDDARREVAVVVGVLDRADAGTIEHADHLLARLPSSSACDDLDRLRQAVEPPKPARADEVHHLEGELLRAESRFEAGQVADAEALAEELERSIAAVDYPPLTARHQLLTASLEFDRADTTAATARARAVFNRALADGDEPLALHAAVQLVTYESYAREGGLELSTRWYEIARALASRRRPGPRLEVDLRTRYARVLGAKFESDEAIALAREALGIAEAELGERSLETAGVQVRLGALLAEYGQREDGRAQLERAHATIEGQLGRDHPRIADVTRMLGMLAFESGDTDTAIEMLADSHALLARYEGRDHADTLEVLASLAAAHDEAGHHRRARALHEDILDALGEREAPHSGVGLQVGNSLCYELYQLGELEEAERLCLATLSGAVARHGEEHPRIGIVLNNLALIARARDDPTTALQHDRQALAIQEASVGDDHPFTAYALVGIGESLLDLGRAGEAISPLARAVSIREPLGDAGEIGEARCLMGQAVAATGESDRARELLERAVEELESGGPRWAALAEACRES